MTYKHKTYNGCINKVFDGYYLQKLVIWLQTVADPEFPRGGGTNSLGKAPTYFAKFSQKLHEIERIWTPRVACIPHALLRSTTASEAPTKDELT